MSGTASHAQPSWPQRLKRILGKLSYRDVINSSQPLGWDEFYSRFEEHFRGTPELIANRLLERYHRRLDDVFKQIAVADEANVLIDLGCGRGEFLDLARTVGFVTMGVDSSEQMCLAANSRGHRAEHSDLVAFLRQQPSNFAAAITSFHVIEHCSAHYVWTILQEAHRVLRPGGLFLLETPSIASLFVAARQFYLDPTHQRPVHLDYLAFAVRDAGFKHVELLPFDEVEGDIRVRLSDVGDQQLREKFERLEEWLYGPQDVACWARK